MVDDAVAFPTLDGSELVILDAFGTRRSVGVGEYLFREGDATYDFYVIVSGASAPNRRRVGCRGARPWMCADSFSPTGPLAQST
jgi:hypothetical protein